MTVLWVEPTANTKDVATAAIEAGADAVIADPDELEGLARIDVRTRNGDAIEGADGAASAVRIDTPEDQDTARSLLGKVDTLVVETGDWTVIPLENLIAWARETNTRLIATVATAEEADVALGTLETGVQGVLLRTDDAAEVKRLGELIAGRADETIELEPAEIVEVRTVRMGDRVCVDTVAMLEPDEGLLVGSSAACMFLVGSEARDSDYVAARPFRVNAGAVHAYVRVPGGQTRYLAEVGAGEEVTVVHGDGRARSVAVGRCKIERRPMLLVRARIDGDEASVVVQNAETIKLVTPDGPVSVVELGAGDRVLVHRGHAARHFGVAVDETIREV